MRLQLVDPHTPPPGPFQRTFWRSPLRGPWLTSLLGFALLVAIPIVVLTGFLSNDAYYPRLGGNSIGRPLGPLDVYLFSFPTHPSWLYALTQGLHVAIGLAAFPIVLAKLWSVLPKLFEWPPARGPAHALERLSLALLVGGALFEFGTGILNVQYFYPFPFFFTTAHYYGAWMFTAAFAFHVVVRFGTMRKALSTRRAVGVLRERLVDTEPEPVGALESQLIPVAPAAPTMSRRALLGTVGLGSLFLLLQGAGQSIGGPLRSLALFAPRSLHGDGPNGFPINRTAVTAGVTAEKVGARWRLRLVAGTRVVTLSREQLLRLPQRTYDLPIACVEGWSTTQRWTGVPIARLAKLVGVDGAFTVETQSIANNGLFDAATLAPEQTGDGRTLLALRVNGRDLSLDHGYPARVIGPGIPGVHCTKWARTMTFALLWPMVARFRRLYGASPLHVLALAASLLIAAAAIAGWFQAFPGPTAAKVVGWLFGAVLVHDLVLLPLYSLFDRIAFGPRRVGESRRPAEHTPGIAYVRVPALLSGLLFLVFFPEILRLGDRNFFLASGLHQRVFLSRYLLTCGVLFALSGVAFSARLARVRRRAAAQSRTRPSPARTARAPRTRALAQLVSLRRTRGGRRRAGTRRS
jgi:DMSO/TMAO reductase YedYZ molybdopterin-dependent catalytic subunit